MEQLKLIIPILICAFTVHAHVRWYEPAERAEADLKIAPCGGVPAGDLMAEYTAGDTIPLKFEEYINHPGWYSIFFSTGDEDSFTLVDSIIDTLDAKAIWVYNYVVPEIECESCILRVRMTMTDKQPPDLYYHSCFDFSITLPEVKILLPENAGTEGFSLTNGVLAWNNTETVINAGIYNLQGALKFKVGGAGQNGLSSKINISALNLPNGSYIFGYIIGDERKSFEFKIK